MIGTNNDIEKMKYEDLSNKYKLVLLAESNMNTPRLYDITQLLSVCMGDLIFLKSMLDKFVCEEAI